MIWARSRWPLYLHAGSTQALDSRHGQANVMSRLSLLLRFLLLSWMWWGACSTKSVANCKRYILRESSMSVCFSGSKTCKEQKHRSIKTCMQSSIHITHMWHKTCQRGVYKIQALPQCTLVMKTLVILSWLSPSGFGGPKSCSPSFFSKLYRKAGFRICCRTCAKQSIKILRIVRSETGHISA